MIHASEVLANSHPEIADLRKANIYGVFLLGWFLKNLLWVFGLNDFMVGCPVKGGFTMKENEFSGWGVEETIKVLESGGRSNVLVNGKPYMTWDTEDEASRRMAIVQLYVSGMGRQENLARVFGVHVNSVEKYIADFTERGLSGLIARPAGPKTKWKITSDMRGKILLIVLNEKTYELEAIQKRLKEVWHNEVSLPTISQVLAEKYRTDV
jgi:transposase